MNHEPGMIPDVAIDNPDGVQRVRTRLHDDVIRLFHLCSSNGFFPLWLLSRSMFPIAESIAALLYGNVPGQTSATLAKFIHDDLGAIDGRYKPLASTLCQVWRHGLTHHDEPPYLIVRPATQDPLTANADTRAVSWRLAFNDPANHMTFATYGQTVHFTFSLTTFLEHLAQVLDDQAKWAGLPQGIVKDRYNEWLVKVLDENKPNSEAGKAAGEILAVLP